MQNTEFVYEHFRIRVHPNMRNIKSRGKTVQSYSHK